MADIGCYFGVKVLPVICLPVGPRPFVDSGREVLVADVVTALAVLLD